MSYYQIYPRFALCLFLLTGGFFQASSQDTTLTVSTLTDIVVRAAKLEKPWVAAPQSTYLLPTQALDQLAQNSLQELLLQSPSVFALNAHNKAQDLRIAIRGFGSRAAFGVRGVKIIVDGIPETTADGQGQLDNLNLGIIQQIEVLNNGSAALYGNASGGVIDIQTLDETALVEKPQRIDLGLGVHAYGGQQHQLTAAKRWDRTSLIVHANHHQGEGYREQAAFQSTNFNLRLIQELPNAGKLELLANYMDSPVADDPGGLPKLLYDSIPRSAWGNNLRYRAGEAIRQGKTALRYRGPLSQGLDLHTYLFYSGRTFAGRLPLMRSGMIDLSRNFYGQGTSVAGEKTVAALGWKWQAGYDWAEQVDDRSRFNNLEGEQGELLLRQAEQFRNLGIYWINDWSWQQWLFNLALRYDLNQIRVADEFLANGDDSGQIDLNDFNYALGVAWAPHPAQRIFANLSTSFETPTLNELSNNPDGSGFNPELAPQRATHFELGWKGYLKQQSRFQVSAFWIQSTNELLPFELASAPGRTFFRNAGQTRRIGLEGLLNHTFAPDLRLGINGAYHRFTYTDYRVDGDDFSGRILPGLANFQGLLTVDARLWSCLNVHLEQQLIGRIFMDDANSAFQSPSFVTNLSLQYEGVLKRLKLRPYLGVNNLLGTVYADNIRINAFGGRFYEAAPRQFVFGGLRLGFE